MSRSPGQSGKCCAPLERRLSGLGAVSINISLRWSENQLDCCAFKLNPQMSNETYQMMNDKYSFLLQPYEIVPAQQSLPR